MPMTPMMKCGHSANAISGGKPACVICHGDPRSLEVDNTPPDLSARQARCSYYGKTPNGRNHSSDTCKRGEVCYCEQPSSSSLAFFQYHPTKPHDEYYCGCFGWE